MNRFARIVITVSLICMLTVSLLFLTFTRGGKVRFLSQIIEPVVSPIESFLSKPVNYFSEQRDRMMDLFATYEENERLKETLFSLETRLAESDTLRKENESLRANLQMIDQYPDKQFIQSSVLSRTPELWVRQMTIARDRNNQLTKGMLVLANGGLIGTIKEVHSSSATVKLLSNSDEFTKIPIRLQVDNQEVYGILSGYDTDSNSFIVNQLNSGVAIPIGTNVVTSDLAGATPSNIQIGKVRSVKESTSDLNRELFIEPTANFSNVYFVLVVGN